MTADARQQAEQMVDEYGNAIADTWQEGIERGWTSAETVERAQGVRDPLVQALAAAIEETQAESANAIHGGVPCDQWAAARERLRLARIDRREALSALGVEVDGARPHSGDSAKEDGDE